MSTYAAERVFLIVNPCAGQMRSRTGLFEIVRVFCAQGWDVTVHSTASRGDARVQTASRGGGFDRIVCCGGDGTLNEVISGMIDAGIDVPLGYIPAGTTNDFASTVSIPKTIRAAAENVVNGVPVAIDIGRFGEENYFVYIASFGAFTRVSYETPQATKNTLGHMAYVLAGARELAEIRPRRVRLVGRGFSMEEEVLMAAVTNTTSIGGIISLPRRSVKLGDGLFEVLLIKPPKTPGELNNLFLKLSHRDFQDENLRLLQSETMEFITAEETAWTRDGENGGAHRRVRIENLRKRIRIIVPDKQYTWAK